MIRAQKPDTKVLLLDSGNGVFCNAEQALQEKWTSLKIVCHRKETNEASGEQVIANTLAYVASTTPSIVIINAPLVSLELIALVNAMKSDEAIKHIPMITLFTGKNLKQSMTNALYSAGCASVVKLVDSDSATKEAVSKCLDLIFDYWTACVDFPSYEYLSSPNPAMRATTTLCRSSA